MTEAEPSPPALRLRECWIACCLALLLGALVVGRPLWDADQIYLATDTASVQAPWRATQAPRNSQLSDSGVAFYPHYRKLAERWGRGELPLWNPDLHVGVPLLANPQWGALDPQVGLLVLLDVIGGERLFDWGFALLAALRIAAAALGTYLLARLLLFTRSAAGLAAVGYALSGSVTLWLGYSLAHVTPCLPWVLFGIEWMRRAPRLLGGWITTSLAMALAIYGGHPEVAFFVGLSGGVWALSLLASDVRRARMALLALACGVLLAAPALVPFGEYLANSGALLAHQLAPSERRMPDILGIGMLLGFLGLVQYSWGAPLSSSAFQGRLRVLLVGVGIGVFLFVAELRGAQLQLGLHEVLSIEAGSLRFGAPILILALVGALHAEERATRSRLLLWLALLSWALAVSFPGVVDLWHWLPLVGLAAPARAACCAALFLALLAGHGLMRARREQVVAACLGLLLFAGASGAWRAPDPAAVLSADSEGAVVSYSRLPQVGENAGASGLAGAIHGGLRADRMTLRFERLGTEGRVDEISAFTGVADLAPPDESGAQLFDFGHLDVVALGPGMWRLRLEFERAGEVLGHRTPALVSNPLRGARDWTALLAAAGVALVLLSRVGAAGRLTVVVLTVIPGWQLASSWNPSVPRAEHLFESRTERFLAREFPGERFLAAPGILPADTALLAGLSTIDGYDALDVASFDGYRAFAMRPDRNPLLHWNADGIDLESPAFRLFGVRMLLLHARRELPGWTLVAGPVDVPEKTEVFIYRAEDPLPRAFCVKRILRREDVLAALGDFDPSTSAFLEDSLSYGLDEPFESSRVQTRTREPELLEFEVELDGEGLFVSTEQHFPGWRLWVDGQQRPILRVNSLFRGVLLGAGTHHLRFVYAPDSWQRGRWLFVLGALLFGVGWMVSRKP